MPPTLHATLVFNTTDIAELLQAHVESQGYFVEGLDQRSILGDGSEIADPHYDVTVKVRPMTSEERALHDLPTESVEDRLQAKIDGLVEDTERAFGRIQRDFDKQSKDMQHALDQRLEELREINESTQAAMLEIQALAEEQAAAPLFPPEPVSPRPPVIAPVPHETPATLAPAPVTSRSPDPAPARRVESLSFADAAEALRGTQSTTELENEELRRANYARLRAEIEQDAVENAFAEDIEGASTEFPSDEAVR